MSLRVLTLALALLLGGCATERTPEQAFTEEATPRCVEDAHALEQRAYLDLDLANQTRFMRKRQEYYALALDLLRQARDLYLEELRDEPGSPQHQENCQRELDRLSDIIDRLHRERPIG